jgi:hypothetical protein
VAGLRGRALLFSSIALTVAWVALRALGWFAGALAKRRREMS